MGGQVVDTGTAGEFMQQTLQKISHDELRAIAADLERKAERFRTLLADGAEAPAPDAVLHALRAIFGVRRRVRALLAQVGEEQVTRAVASLLAPRSPVDERVDAFVAALPGFDDIATDVASELLHFTDPDRYWLWTKWMWDPTTETGALRLVTMEEVDLYGSSPGDTYLKVGRAVAFVHETGRAVGFTALGAGPFGLDVFLACVYGIYMYTVLRMRMTQEFNHVVPQLPELARRLLGVYRMEG